MEFKHVTPANWVETAEQLHLSAVVTVGNMVHISGSTGRSSDASPEAQFTAAFEDVADLLATVGSGWGDVVKMTTYHAGGLRTHLKLLLAVKDRYIQPPYPAWTGVGVSELANPHALVEIDVVADLSTRPDR